MPIQLDEPTIEAPPSVTIADIGNSIVVALVDTYQIPLTDFTTGLPELYGTGHPKEGQARHQEVIVGLVVNWDGAQVGRKDERRDPVAGETVAIYAAKGGLFEWIQAKKDHRGLHVGDVVRWWLDHEEPPKTKGFNPYKVRKFAIRSPRPDEAAQTAACEQAHLERNEPAQTPIQEPPVFDPAEAPF